MQNNHLLIVSLLLGTHFPPGGEQFCWPRGTDQQAAAADTGLQGAVRLVPSLSEV